MKPILSKQMLDAALDALQNERFVMGESVFKFEEEFAHYVGAKHAVSTGSGTTALNLSIIAIDRKSRSEAITTPASFIATTNAILQAGGKPVFADIDAQTNTLNPLEVEKTITNETNLILPVHLYGYPADMDWLMEIAQQHDLRIIEDACQAHGAVYKGRRIGSISDAACFSFYPSKNMTVCGDGGMITTNDEDIANSTAKLRDCGRISKYLHDCVGFTARLNTVNAAIGRVQLKHLEEWNQKRRQVAETYRKLLFDLRQVELPPRTSSGTSPAYHLFVIKTEHRDKLGEYLQKHGIECGVHYPVPIHMQPIYKKRFHFERGMYPVCEKLSDIVLSIPLFVEMRRDEIEYVSERVWDFFRIEI